MCSCKWVQILKKLLLIVFLVVLMSNLVVAIVFALPQTDPTGDCLSLDQDIVAGDPVLCQPIGDITQVDLLNSGRGYLITITFAGNIPSKFDNYTIQSIEWNLLIDADRNNLTSPWAAAGTATDLWLANGLGVDYTVTYTMNRNSAPPSTAEIWDGSTETTHTTPVQINGNQIAMTFLPSDISHSSDFYFLVLVIMHVEGTLGGYSPTLFDKAPNVGYYEYKAAGVTAVPEFPGAQQVISIIIFAIGATVLSRRRKTSNWKLA